MPVHYSEAAIAQAVERVEAFFGPLASAPGSAGRQARMQLLINPAVTRACCAETNLGTRRQDLIETAAIVFGTMVAALVRGSLADDAPERARVVLATHLLELIANSTVESLSKGPDAYVTTHATPAGTA